MHAPAPLRGLAAEFGYRPLWHQLALLILATALPLIVSSALMFNRLVVQERASIREDLLVSARTLAGLVDNEIDTHSAIGAALSHSPTLQIDDLAEFWREAKQALDFVPGSWLVLSTPQGRMVLNTLTPPGTPLPEHFVPEFMQHGFASRRPQVSDLAFDSVAQRLTAFVAVPVFRDSRPLYSLSISLAPERFLGLIESHFTKGEIVGIVDRRAHFVARNPDHKGAGRNSG